MTFNYKVYHSSVKKEKICNHTNSFVKSKRPVDAYFSFMSEFLAPRYNLMPESPRSRFTFDDYVNLTVLKI